MTAGPIGDLGSVGQSVQDSKSTSAINPADGGAFRDFLLNNLEKVNQMQNEADTAINDLVTGKETDITKVMSTVEKADVAFQTLMAVRGKLVDSYKEVMQMRL